ncbi:hypothetical protein LSH36_244g00023 [Paralvinella palmiformis]|uniref:Uncharacterized protein n=1 Tax=Paralvinella palmiformis TaxID=53620 RepID=A0AAD9N5P5_9ANNE|nr:hypothetical protein LSH36_244g00023 [Paralvinella palmiformis]
MKMGKVMMLLACTVCLSKGLADNFICPSGHTLHESRCCRPINCDPGTEPQLCDVNNPSSTSCRLCDNGYYQDQIIRSDSQLRCKLKRSCSKNEEHSDVIVIPVIVIVIVITIIIILYLYKSGRGRHICHMKKTETPGDEENHALKENCNACETLIEYREEKFTDSPNQAIPLETNNSQVAVDTVLFQEESLHPPIQPGDTPSSYGDNHNRESIESSIESLVLTDQTQVKMVCPEASNNSHDLFQSSEQPPPYTSAYTLPTAPQRNVNNTSDADAAPQSSASPLQDDSRQSVGADSVPQPERGTINVTQHIGDGAVVNLMFTGTVNGSVSNNPTMTSLHG